MNKKNILISAIVLVLAVAVLIGGFFWLQKVKNEAFTMGIFSGISNKEKLTIRTYLFSEGHLTRGIYPPLLLFHLEVPREWRSTLVNGSDVPMRFSAFNYNLARLKFVAPDNITEESNIRPVNRLDFYDASGVTRDPENMNDNIHILGEPEIFFDALIQMRDKKEVGKLPDCSAIWFDDCPAKWKTIYIETADGVFSGFAQLRGNSQDFSYSPTLHLYIAGRVAKRVIYIEGSFELYDAYRAAIDKQISSDDGEITISTENALNRLMSDSLAEDTQKQVNQIAEVIKSIRVEISERK